MKRLSKTFVALAGALIASSSAYAQQPPDIVQSDASNNIAMGPGVMDFLNHSTGGAFDNIGIGVLALHQDTTGISNVAIGVQALTSNSTGAANVGIGLLTMYSNVSGNWNTAIGTGALQSNTTGNSNTAVGFGALITATTGQFNTAAGLNALAFNTTAAYNTAYGIDALCGNTTGSANTATGAFALSGGYLVTDAAETCPAATGDDNTASGAYALLHNTSGSYNTAAGFQSLSFNTTGYRNEADGAWALQFNTSGHDNTASGQGSLHSNTSGSYNVALGANAGYDVTTGYHNIEIDNLGNPTDSGTIRIGTPVTHVATFIAGISSAHVTGSAVYVTSTGQLGVLASSERYKTAITPMGERTEKLAQLRPVIFQLKTDPHGARQYGLIAEEVAKVYPELAIRDEKGEIQGVRYEELAPMLLNEAQRQRVEIAQLRKQQRREIDQLKQQLRQLQAAFAKVQSTDEFVAKR